MEKTPKNIVLNRIEARGESFYYKEFSPPIIGGSFPKILKMDDDYSIFWGDSSTGVEPKFNIEGLDRVPILEQTTKDLFSVIDEQQSRIDDLTDKLNQIINFLK